MAGCQGSVDVMSVFEPLQDRGNVKRRYTRRYYNETGLAQSGKLIFEVTGQLDPISFYDSCIGFNLQIVKKDGTNLVADTAVSMCQQPGLSIIRHVDVYANGRKCHSHQYHHVSAYIENTVNYGEEAQKSWLQGALWADDDSGKYDVLTVDGQNNTSNSGFKRRMFPFRLSREVEMRVKPQTFPFTEKALWPGEIRWRFVIELNDDQIMLMCATDLDAKVLIVNPFMDIECVRLESAEQDVFVKSFRGEGPATYTFGSVALEAYPIRANTSHQRVLHSLMKPQAPTMLLICLVTETAFMGDTTKNPFSFKPHGLKEMTLKIDGDPVHYDSLKFDWTKGHYLASYWELLRCLQVVNRDEGLSISRWHYDEDQFFVAVDLTRLIDPCDLSTTHDLSIEVTFHAPTTVNLRMLCYARYAQEAMVGYDEEFGQGAQLLVKMAH
jgi:hypothetical protein